MKTSIYLDYNATAPLRSGAQAAMQLCLSQPLNASAVHALGREGRRIVEAAREQVAALCGVPAAQVIFNSGATEGNNTVLKYFTGERVLVSAIEHPSVLHARSDAVRIDVNSQGVIDLDKLEAGLKEKRTALASLMWANNETGIIQPIAEAAALAHRHGALFHCDGVQAAGRLPIDIAAAGIDFLTLSSHKIGGPQGAGALVLGLCGVTPVLLEGGGQEKKARAGTENVAAIAGFGAAAQEALQGLSGYETRLRALQTKLESGIQSISPEAYIYGADQKRLPNTTLFGFDGFAAEAMLMNFDLEGIALSNGSACTSGSVQPSHVLLAIGEGAARASGALRISMGWDTQEGDIEAFLKAWETIYTRMKKKDKKHA